MAHVCEGMHGLGAVIAIRRSEERDRRGKAASSPEKTSSPISNNLPSNQEPAKSHDVDRESLKETTEASMNAPESSSDPSSNDAYLWTMFWG